MLSASYFLVILVGHVDSVFQPVEGPSGNRVDNYYYLFLDLFAAVIQNITDKASIT